MDFEANTLSLFLSIPQAYVLRTARGYVDPSLWDDGVPALYTDYGATYSRNDGNGQHSDYYYLGLRSGNIGGWRFRNESSLSGSSETGSRFSSNRTYVERNFASLRGKASAGELYTPGDIFESVRFRRADRHRRPCCQTARWASHRPCAASPRAMPWSRCARTATSSIDGGAARRVRDQRHLSERLQRRPRDPYHRGRRTRAPLYAAVLYLPVMVRHGSLRYALAGGQYRGEGSSRPKFLQGTMVYGVSEDWTAYGGIRRRKTTRRPTLAWA